MSTLAAVFREVNTLKADELGAVNRQRLRELLSAHGIMMEIDDGP